MAKKYYWFKLKNDFFKRHDIKIIEGMKDGDKYVLLYLKLMVESVSHEGRLRFSKEIPYNEEMLASITNMDKKIVEEAIKLFRQMKMIYLYEDGTYFIPMTNKLTGSETEWAEKKRRQREGQQEDNVPHMSIECPYDNVQEENRTQSDKSKSKSKSKSIDIEKENSYFKLNDEILDTILENRKLHDEFQKHLKLYNETMNTNLKYPNGLYGIPDAGEIQNGMIQFSFEEAQNAIKNLPEYHRIGRGDNTGFPGILKLKGIGKYCNPPVDFKSKYIEPKIDPVEEYAKQLYGDEWNEE